MGQSLMKFAPGGEDKKIKEIIIPKIEESYKKHFGKKAEKTTFGDFYQAVCETVENINKAFGNTQFKVPNAEKLEKAYDDHHKQRSNGSVTKNEFQMILRDILLTTDTGFTGLGAKDTLIYIFGVPIVTLFIKQGLIPRAIPNYIFIPGVTSATVFALAKLNKI